MKFKKFTLLFVFALSAVMLKAQDPKLFKTWLLDIEGGVSNSFTDIERYNLYPAFGVNGDLNYYFGLGVKKSLTPVFGVKAKLNVGRTQGSLLGETDASRNAAISYGLLRPVYHKANLYSGSLNLVVNFSNIGFFTRNTAKERKLIFYGIAGIGALGYDAELLYQEALPGSILDKDQPVLKSQTPFVDQDDEDIEAVFNGGFGLKYKLSKSIDLGLEFNYNVTTTDALDGLDVPGTGVDKYGTTVLRLAYKLPSKNGAEEHLDWANPGSDLIAKVEEMDKKLDSLDNTVAEHINNSDTDGDGVPDVNDKEPYSLFGAEVDANGVAKDSDGDGVPDGLDKEPDTPKGELVNYQGISIKDQVVGKLPQGPTKEEVENMIKNANNAYFPSVFFATNSASVRSAAMKGLVSVATAMQKNPNLKITVTGHADKRGSEGVNNALAKRRAEAVKKYLVRNLGITESRITVNSKGETEPMSSTIYSINRRVDIAGQ